jgi:TonB-dependent starch-binding outer membrane protein SusC
LLILSKEPSKEKIKATIKQLNFRISMKKLSLLFLLFFSVVGTILAQRNIEGKITDAKGEAVIGANILAKGTSAGASSDADGNYRFSVPAGATTIVVSYTGFATQEIKLGVSNVIDLMLETDSKFISEIVVTGTGVATDKSRVSVDVQALSSKALPPAPSASVDQALVGKIAGAQISTVNGTPGAKVSILLRGINSINRSTNPMIMLDGVEMGATELQTIDLNIIDRVEVVQGAVAGSIYGAQGANGVIQLFTKRGRSGKVNIDFSTSYSNNSYLNNGNLRKADLHGFDTDANNNVLNGDLDAPLAIDSETGSYLDNLSFASTNPKTVINKPYDKNLPYYDHFKMFLQDASTINNSLSLSGGSDRFDFAISASDNRQGSNFKGNGDYRRSNLMTNLGFEIAKGLKLRSITQLGYTNSTINDEGGNATIYALFNSRPFANYEAKLVDGTYPAYLGDATGVNGLNPFFINQYTSTSSKRIDLNQNLNLNYQPVKYLEFDVKYGLNYRTDNNDYLYKNQSFNPNIQYWENWKYSFNDGDATGETNNYQTTTKFTNLLSSAILKLDFKEDFKINLPIKSSTQFAYDYRNKSTNEYRVVGLGTPGYEPFTDQQTTIQQIKRDRTTPFVTFGYLVNQNFEVGNVLSIGGGFRSDYSSAFGGGSKAFTFPRGNANLRISSFDFWKNSALGRIIPVFKLRGGFGSAGIQPKPFDRYPVLETRTVDGNSPYIASVKPNPNLDVEVSKEIEIGADLSLAAFKGQWLNSIVLSPTYWKRSTSNAIWDVDVAPSTGINAIKENSFSLGSNGLQLTAKVQVADTKNFSWDFTINYGKQTSEITKVKGRPVVLLTAAGSTSYILEEGTKVGQLFGFLGLNDVNQLDKNGAPYIPADQQAGYEVASNGWVVNKTSKAPYFTPGQYSFGDPNPDFILNFINGFTFKKILGVNFQIDWVQGAHRYNQTKEWMYRDGIHSDYQVPITINGETAAWSAFYRGVYAERSRNGTKSYFYEDASFVRLRNIDLTVNIHELVKIKSLRNCQLILSGRNLWTKTKYTGLDPEANSSNAYELGDNSPWDRATDHNSMPNLKSYQVGFRIGF